MKALWISMTLALLPGCLAIRAGGGASHRGGSAQPPGTYDAELALVLPLPREGDGPAWIASPVAIVRGGSSDGGWAMGGLELARRVGARPPRATLVRCASADWLAGTQLGGRLEAGRDDLGRYLGGAVVVRHLFAIGGACPIFPSVSLVLNAGAYTGPVHGPAAGLHLLVGFD